MNKILSLLFVLFLTPVFSSTISAQTVTPEPTLEPTGSLIQCIDDNEDAVVLQGEIAYVGSQPFSDLVLVESRDINADVYLVAGELLEELEGSYAQEIEICGVVYPAANRANYGSIEVIDYVSLEVEEIPTPTPTERPRQNLTQETVETIGPLERILEEQEISGGILTNPIKYAIRNSVSAGIPPNTIVLLLLLPGVAAIIAASRHIIGLRGFGIFIPAALSVVFISTGPLVGIGLFLIIVFMSTLTRVILRKLQLKLQYLPRMALLLWSVVLGILLVLFIAPIFGQSSITQVSIFPVLILVLLAEDFTRVQLGKSAKTAINITSETLILALVSYFVLTMQSVQALALLHPEAWILAIALFNLVLGRYVGLRFMELWRFRRIIKK